MARGTTLPPAPLSTRQQELRAAAVRLPGEVRAAEEAVAAAEWDREQAELDHYLGGPGEAAQKARARHHLEGRTGR